MLFRLLLSFLLIQLALTAQGSHLALSSIHGEMEKILEGHISQKKMTPELVADSLQSYITQFDPHAVYLLASEIKPYIKLSSAQKESLFEQYEQNDFSRFSSLNKMIQQAIKRSEEFRRTLHVDLSLADVPFATRQQKEELPPFAPSIKLLQKRHASMVAHLVKRELEEQKISLQDARQIVEADLEEFENGYLFVDRQGTPLPTDLAQELFTFHVLKAMTASLDAHTSYLNPYEAEIMRMKLEKKYVGIGLVLEQQGNSFAVAQIIKGSSADESGVIRVGDLLQTIDGKPVLHVSISTIHGLLEGEPNTFVILDLMRGRAPIRVTLERKQIEIQEGRVNTSFEKFDGGIIGCIALHSFYQGTGSISSEKDVEKAFALLASHGKVKGIILDLRDNRGGFLMQAVKVAGLFLKSGVIVAAKYSDGSIHYFRDLDPTVLYRGPLIVLVSKETASAAEIVAQALKDYGVAIIVGDSHTFGKGSIQMQTVTGGEKKGDSYFKVTIGRYYGVSGESSQLEGVKADIIVPSFLSEKKIGEEYLSKAISHDSIPPSYKDPLTDIPAAQKPWFQEYYAPYVQEPVDLYRRFIPQLKAASAKRMEKQEPVEEKQASVQLQLQETIEIMKELIFLEKKNALQ